MTGHIEVSIEAPCKRCVDPVVRAVSVDFPMTWVSQRPEPSDDDDEDGSADDGETGPRHASFDDEDVDTEPFDGKNVPLDPIIREQILLNLPLDVLCKPDCKGLCTVCGQELERARLRS